MVGFLCTCYSCNSESDMSGTEDDAGNVSALYMIATRTSALPEEEKEDPGAPEQGDTSEVPFYELVDEFSFTGDVILWFNETTRELRFKDNDAMPKAFDARTTMQFKLNDE